LPRSTEAENKRGKEEMRRKGTVISLCKRTEQERNRQKEKLISMEIRELDRRGTAKY
jgi:hypothetical protein